ncbi:MAG TPA: glycosyltransferase [Terriglobales bacterium]|nr:glycosyltransferase [Terriglobales bacterium]
MATVLYLTFDGLLQPIAQANVIPYLRQLASLGHPIHIVSLERTSDLADVVAISAVKLELADADISWQPLPYSSGGAGAMLRNLFRAFNALWKTPRSRPLLVHARSYPPAAVAWVATRLLGGNYIFDMRGYWIDEKRAVRKWFTHDRIYAIGKRIERRLVRDAAAVVTLTQLQASDLQHLRRQAGEIVVVPTCTNYDKWSAPKPLSSTRALLPRLKGRLVVTYVGSHTNAYLLPESIELFRQIYRCQPNSYLLCITRDPLPLRSAIMAAGLPSESWSDHSVCYSEMPAWLSLAHWGLLLLEPGLAKRGSVPTKLAEFFAARVRPVLFGCNDEVANLVRLAGSGIVLNETSTAALRECAATIACTLADPQVTGLACARTRPLLDIQAGAAAYAALYARLNVSRAAKPVAEVAKAC